MAISKLSNHVRDEVITAFRQRICAEAGIVPLRHQAEWWAASDGAILTSTPDHGGPSSGMEVQVQEPDGQITNQRFSLIPRPDGRAKVLSDLGAFKVGKSYGAGTWASAFAAVPNARVQLVGLEYDICVPEFEYIVETLLSERGMGLRYATLQNRPRDGRMWLDFENGARFEARSWERKDTLKGKEIDCYIYCEAYMLPGLECYTSFSQNLRARDGYAVFATTPDRPWVAELRDAALSGKPEFAKWHCTYDVPASENPATFNAEAMERDKSLMTREKFAIHYMGRLERFVGQVFNYQRGDRTFTPETHPQLWTTS